MLKQVTNRFTNIWCGMDVIEFDHKYYIFAYPSVRSEDYLSAFPDGPQTFETPEAIHVPFTISEAKEHQKKYPEQTQFSLLNFPSSIPCDCGGAKAGTTCALWCSTLNV